MPEFQPQPSTSKAFHQEEGGEITTSYDMNDYDRNEELESKRNWETYSDTEDEGKLMKFSK